MNTIPPVKVCPETPLRRTNGVQLDPVVVLVGLDPPVKARAMCKGVVPTIKARAHLVKSSFVKAPEGESLIRPEYNPRME